MLISFDYRDKIGEWRFRDRQDSFMIMYWNCYHCVCEAIVLLLFFFLRIILYANLA